MLNNHYHIIIRLTRLFTVGLLCWTEVGLGQSTTANETHLLVATAANFRQAITALKPLLEGEDLHLTLVFSATGSLFQQARLGAPFDVFLAADSIRPKALEAEGLTLPNSRHIYAQGQLALWSRQAGLDLRILLEAPTGRIAIAKPKLAPYGKATQQCLQSLSLWGKLSKNIVWGRNINQAFLLAASGQAVAAFVSVAQIATLQGGVDLGSVWRIPATCHTPIEQQVVALARTDYPQAAHKLIRRLLSQESQQIIESFGYISRTSNRVEQ